MTDSSPLRVVPAGSLRHENIVSAGPGIAKARSLHLSAVQRIAPVQVGARFKTARLAAGLSQARAARLYGCDVRSWRSWECERSEVPARALLWVEALAAERVAA